MKAALEYAVASLSSDTLYGMLNPIQKQKKLMGTGTSDSLALQRGHPRDMALGRPARRVSLGAARAALAMKNGLMHVLNSCRCVVISSL